MIFGTRPSLQNIAILLQEGADVRVWDPSGYKRIKELYPHIACCNTIPTPWRMRTCVLF